MLKVTIPNAPISKPATSIGLINGRVRTWNKSTKTKNELREWLQKNLTAGQKEMIEKNPEVEIHVIIKYWMPIPASTRRVERRLMEWGLVPHVSKPDNSNMGKFHEDAVNGILWPDDRQIVKLYQEKEYSRWPRVEYFIKIKEPRMNDKMKAIYGHLSIDTVRDLCYVCSKLSPYLETLEHLENGDQECNLRNMSAMASVLEKLCLDHGEKLGTVCKKLRKLDAEKDEL